MFSVPTTSRPATRPGTGTTARVMTPGAVRTRPDGSPTPRPSSPRPRPTTPSTRPVLKSNYTPTQMTERYTNRAYNRQPSPPGRFPRPQESRRPTGCEERPRERRAVEERSTGPRLLESCRPSKPRGVPIESKRSESTTSLASRRVLTAVKEVLSKAVIERGRIDQDNLGTILKSMKSRLLGEESEEDGPRMDVEGKESRVTVNIEESVERPMIGIVRRPVDYTAQRSYHKVYRARSQSAQRPDRDREEVVYITLPDDDYSKFTSLIRKEKKISKDSELRIEERKKCCGKETHQEENRGNPTNERTVGDCNPRDLYNAAEDLKLQRYIETLVRNLNDQLNKKKSRENIEATTEYKSTICKSFCVCKVCSSTSPTPKRVTRGSKLSIEHIEGENTKESDMEETVVVKQKSPLVTNRTTTSSNLRVVKGAPLESRAISPRPKAVRAVAMEVTPKKSYTVVETGQAEEASADMYMRRRIRSPARRR